MDGASLILLAAMFEEPLRVHESENTDVRFGHGVLLYWQGLNGSLSQV